MAKKNVLFLTILCCLFCVSFAFAKTPEKHSFEMDCMKLKNKMPQIQIDNIQKGPLGLCEIWSGQNVFYFAPKEQLLVFASLSSSASNTVLLLHAEEQLLVFASLSSAASNTVLLLEPSGAIRSLAAADIKLHRNLCL